MAQGQCVPTDAQPLCDRVFYIVSAIIPAPAGCFFSVWRAADSIDLGASILRIEYSYSREGMLQYRTDSSPAAVCI